MGLHQMEWIALSYTLPARGTSSTRVALWRRLRRLGALPQAGGASILPARADCIEAFGWIAQEIAQSDGDALVMRVDRFDGLSDGELIERFRDARRTDYAELDAQAELLERDVLEQPPSNGSRRYQETLARLRRRHAEIMCIDYFPTPEGTHVGARLIRIGEALMPGDSQSVAVEPAETTQLLGRHWVTRPRPHVDRLACIWLIRHFIDPNAVIRYAAQPEGDEIPFDMRGARFGHQGNRCSFETMLAALSLDDSALRLVGEIVHEIDLRDDLYQRPEVPGVDAILKGWLTSEYADPELESHGVALFDGLYGGLTGGILNAGVRPRSGSGHTSGDRTTQETERGNTHV